MVEVKGLLCKPPHPGKANIASAAASHWKHKQWGTRNSIEISSAIQNQHEDSRVLELLAEAPLTLSACFPSRMHQILIDWAGSKAKTWQGNLDSKGEYSWHTTK